MTKQAYLNQDGVFMKLFMARKIHIMYETTTTSLAKLNIMLTICQVYFIAKVEQDLDMLGKSIIANSGMDR